MNTPFPAIRGNPLGISWLVVAKSMVSFCEALYGIFLLDTPSPTTGGTWKHIMKNLPGTLLVICPFVALWMRKF